MKKTKSLLALCTIAILATNLYAAPKAKKGSGKSASSSVVYTEEGYTVAASKTDVNTVYEMLNQIQEKDIAKEMDKGFVEFLKKDYSTAKESLDKASLELDELLPNSLAAGKRIDATTYYAGNTYEYLLIDAFKALAFYNAGEVGNAVASIRRVGDKQQEYMAHYGDVVERESAADIQNVSQETIDEFKKIAETAKIDMEAVSSTLGALQKARLPEKATRANVYDTSALADYLQIVLTIANGSKLDEYIPKELTELLKKDKSTIASASIPKGMGRIEVLSLVDSIYSREEEVISIPTNDLLSVAMAVASNTVAATAKDDKTKEIAIKLADPKVIKLLTQNEVVGYNIKYPVYKKTGDGLTVKKITLDNGETVIPVLLEDFDEAVKNDVALKARKTAKANIAVSLLVKTPIFPVQCSGFATAYVAAETARAAAYVVAEKLPEALAKKAKDKADATYDASIKKAAKILIDGLNDADPKADLRQSKMLPSKAYCGGFTVAPGTYSVTVEYSKIVNTEDGKPKEVVVKTEVIDNVVVKADKPTLVESTSTWAK